MARLTTVQKRAIVQRLACFETPTEIQQALRDEFGVEVSLSQILYYDPNSAGTDVAAELVELFDETRARFIEDTSDLAIAHRAFRLQELLRLYREAVKRKNLVLAADLLERAAKETGGVYTNPRAVTEGRDDPLPALVVRRETRTPAPASEPVAAPGGES